MVLVKAESSLRYGKNGIPISELAKRTALGKSTLTDLLDRLVDAGLLLRENHSSDRRVTLIRLTDSARKMQDKYEQVSEEMTDLFYQEFTSDEIDNFEVYLHRLLSNLEDIDSS